MSNPLKAQEHKLVSWKDIAAMPLPQPDTILPYGPDPLQYGELRLPDGQGPFPVVVVVHGGCWLAEYDLHYMAHLSEALRQAGYATWNIEFRRVGDAGGGWTGTFLDVAKGTDYLKKLAKHYPLDARETIVLGHSAGGHLALWLAARHNLPKSSPLYTHRPLKLQGVVSLAGITDLETYGAQEGSCNSAVPQLMGGSPADVPTRYADASPINMLPLHVPTRLVQGLRDPIVPLAQAESFTEKGGKLGDDAQLVPVREAGHFDLVAPQAPAFKEVLEAVQSLLPTPLSN